MGYHIEPWALGMFLDDTKIKLPRFQRKSTWKSLQNFKLCISVFKDFPIGVVIINEEQDSSWLLDGRQRRNALKMMRDNPIMIYDWARSFLKFKQTADEMEITNLFWEKIDEYLQRDPAEAAKTDEESDETELEDGTEYEEAVAENSFDPVLQQQSLKTLLDNILMIHQKKKGLSKWERAFDFLTCFNRLAYAPLKNGVRKIDPVQLRRYIVKMYKDYETENGDKNVTMEYFGAYILDEHDIKDGYMVNYRQLLVSNWDIIESSIDVIARTELVIDKARVAVIRLTNASVLDAQNIFSLVNSGGTQLKSEELLSAKPFWNTPVPDVSYQWKEQIARLYEQLEVTKQQDVVRWDLAAVLLSRIDKNHLVFKRYDSGTLNMEMVTLGFKLLSSIFEGGMSGKHVTRLEKNRKIIWNHAIDETIEKLNGLFDILSSIEYFRYLLSWGKSIIELTTNAIALEFVVILLNKWEEIGCPTISSGELNNFKRNAVILFDRLLYENATKGWKGSGDSKMATDIKNPAVRLVSVDETDWKQFIENACNGMIAGSPSTADALRPILYHYYCLTKCSPSDNTITTYDVDHIIPRERFVGNQLIDEAYLNSLINLALLPTKDNISKKSKALDEIKDSWLKQEITRYTGIQESDFPKYSDISNMSHMQDLRANLFIKAFTTERKTVLSN